MAKSFLSDFLNSAAKAVDKSITAYRKETKRQQLLENKLQLAKERAEIQAFNMELKSRQRIINDSIRLIQSTKSLDVLNTRFAAINEHTEWVKSQKMKGLQISINTNENFEAQLLDAYNNGLFRIVSEKAQKVKEYKTPKSQKTNAEKVIRLIDETDLLLKNSNNKYELQSKMDLLRDKLEQFQ